MKTGSIIILLLLFRISSLLSADIRQKTFHEIDSLTAIGLDKIFNLNFLSTDSCIRTIHQHHPEHPLADYLTNVSDFYRIIAGVDYPWDESVFIKNHDQFLDRLETSGESLTADETNFYQGCIYGNLARYWGSQGNWFKAFYNARKAKQLHESVSVNSKYYFDAQLTPGVYHYYAATLPKWIHSLAAIVGLGGNKELGIRQLSQTAEKGTIHRTEALFMLIQILINEGKYEQALDISKQLMKRYPDNPFLTHQTGLILFLMEDYETAETLFADALQRSLNRYAPCEQLSSYHLGRIMLLKNRHAEANHYFDGVFKLEPLTVSFIPTHGWIAGSTCFYAGVASEHLHKAEQATELFLKAIAHEQVFPLIKQKSKFRVKYPMSVPCLLVEEFIHQLIINKNDPDSAQFEKWISDVSVKSYPGLTSRLNFACGKRYLLNQRYKKSVPLFLSVIDSQDDFPDRAWMIPYSYYYLANCMAAENHIQNIQEYLQKAQSYKDYPGEERMRFLYDQMLEAIYR